MGRHYPDSAPCHARGGPSHWTHLNQHIRMQVHTGLPRHGRGGAGPARPRAQRGDLGGHGGAADQHVPARGLAPEGGPRSAPGEAAVAAAADHRRAVRGPAAGPGPAHPPDPDQGSATIRDLEDHGAVHPQHAPRLARRLHVPGFARHPPDAGAGPPVRDLPQRQQKAGLRHPGGPVAAHALPADGVPPGADRVSGGPSGHAVPGEHGIHRARRASLHARPGRLPHREGRGLGALLSQDPPSVRRVSAAGRRRHPGRERVAHPHDMGANAGALRGVRRARFQAEALAREQQQRHSYRRRRRRQGRRTRSHTAGPAAEHNRLLVGAPAPRQSIEG